MALSSDARFVPGVWGPYYSAMVPGLWLNEGGQSALGKLLDHIIDTHPARAHAHQHALKSNVHIHDILNETLNSLSIKNNTPVNELTRDIHIWPDFHGNRSPLADPTLTGMVCGLTLDVSLENLALQYLATIQALAYGTKHIVEVMGEHGYDIQVVHACGGLTKNSLFVQSLADVLDMKVVLPDCREPVLLGAAMLAATASRHSNTVEAAMQKMGGSGHVIQPRRQHGEFHRKKYAVFKKMLADQLTYREMMA